MRDLLERAGFAYFRDRFRYPRVNHPKAWPDYDASGQYRYNARDYVVLRSARDGVLAVYRIRPSNGCLRRLHNYPLVLIHRPKGPGDALYRKVPQTHEATLSASRSN
jgi:hypothetical protein